MSYNRGLCSGLTLCMKREVEHLFPDWTNHIYIQKDLILSDDIDSLMSCCLLKEMTSDTWNINYFYDFKGVYRARKSENDVVAIDIATVRGKNFDNHVTKAYENDTFNEDSANLNLILNKHRHNYCEKYPFSTLLTIWSYYDIDLPISKEGKAILLSIDSAFKGHYTNVEQYKQIHTEWFEILGMTELIDVLEKHDSQYFRRIIDYFRLDEKIKIVDGRLQTNIKLNEIQRYFDFEIALPTKKFTKIRKYKRKSHEYKNNIPDREKLFSLAFTRKDYVNYTEK
jgi:hypothetical protein